MWRGSKAVTWTVGAILVLVAGVHGGPRPESDPASNPGARRLIVTNITLIDVAAGKAIPNRTVVVRGERITTIEPADKKAAPAGALVIDGTGKYLIPGLWDMHAHIADPSYSGWFLRYGVTGIRHMFAVNPLYRPARPADPTAGPVVPRLVIANQILDGPGTAFKWPLRANVVIAADAPAARAAIRDLQKGGNDFVKVYTWLPRDAYFAAVAEAKDLGLPVGGHVPLAVTVAEASDAGQRTVEHLDGVAVQCSEREDRHRADLRVANGLKNGQATGWRVYAEAHDHFAPKKAAALFRTFIKNGTWHVPTLIQNRQMARLAEPDVIPADVEKSLPRFLAHFWKRDLTADGVSLPALGIRYTRDDLRAREVLIRGDIKLVGRMYRAGVRLLAGTDTSAPFVVPGLALHQELGMLVEAGLTPAEALRTATLWPAECLKTDDRLGTIEVGKLADLVLLAKNPLDDIGNTRTVEAVVVGGRVVPR